MDFYRQFEFFQKQIESLDKEQSTIRVALNNYENKKNENTIVKKELELLEDEDIVYKLIGPVLVQQEINDAKMQVNSRLEMINKEINKLERNYRENNKKIEETRNKSLDLQSKLINMARQIEAQKKETK